MSRNVCIVVNSRADAGPLESVVAAFPDCDTVYGELARTDSDIGAAYSMSEAVAKFADEFYRLKPELIIVLGDRYETLGAALAAMFLRIPVAHLHGGETTEGAFDDAIRNGITHIADLHFAAAEEFADKIIAMGRPADTVHVVGAPGLDGVAAQSALRTERQFLVTFHPETRAADYGLSKCVAMLRGLEHFRGYQMVFTGVNTDPGHSAIADVIFRFCEQDPGHRRVSGTIGHQGYIEMMQRAAAVIGNSSSSIIEAPYIGIPTVDVGDRQKGRLMSPSVFHADGSSDTGVVEAINAALAWRKPWQPAYQGGAAERVRAIVDAWLSERETNVVTLRGAS